MTTYHARGNLADADCVIGFSFGTSVDKSGVNYQLAERMLNLAGGRPLIADRTFVNAITNGDRRMAQIIEGEITNSKAQGTGTWGTRLEAKKYMDNHGLKHPLVIAQAHNVSRVVRQGAKLGVVSITPAGLPTDFDVRSKQFWTRSIYLWIPINILGSLLLRKRGQL